jgi:fatty-acyl-CoA synthase
VRIVVAGAPPPTQTIERVETELGWEFIQIYGLTETSPLLTMNRGRAEWDDLDPERAARLARPAGAPAIGVRPGVDDRARCSPVGNHVLEGYYNQPEATARRSSTAGFTPATAARSRRRLRHDLGPQEGRDHHRRRERVVDRGRGRLFSHPEVAEVAVIGVPSTSGARRCKALVVLRPGSVPTRPS